jgi:hypothetical protein
MITEIQVLKIVAVITGLQSKKDLKKRGVP